MTTAANGATSLEQQVRRRMQDWKETFESKDVEGIMTFYAPEEFTAFDLMPPLEFHGGDMWRKNWISFFDAFEGAPQLEITDLDVHGSGELSFVRALVRLSGTMHGNSVDMWVRQTNCFRLIGGEWLMIHDHVSVPTDFATGRSLTGLTPAPRG